MSRPRFTLKAILSIILLISIPLAMVAVEGDWVLGGGLLFIPVTGGSLGYLVKGRSGIYPGAITAMVIVIIGLILQYMVL